MEIKEIIDKIRFRLNDTDEVVRSDYEMLLAINECNRYFRDICLESNPDLIARHFRGVTEDFEGLVVVPANSVKITEVRCNGVLIHAAKMTEVKNTETTGVPTQYVPKIIGDKICLLLFPRPKNSITYSIDYIPEIEEYDFDDSMDLSNDIVCAIIDYVVAKLNGSDETGAAGKLHKLINDVAPSPCVVESYY